jgi:hypothetical protein
MTAVPVLVPKVSHPAARDAEPARVVAVHPIDRQSRGRASQGALPNTIAQGTPAPDSWQLTNRGIAVAMAIAAIILAAAMLVIGITAARVTSPDYDPAFQQSQQNRR